MDRERLWLDRKCSDCLFADDNGDCRRVPPSIKYSRRLGGDLYMQSLTTYPKVFDRIDGKDEWQAACAMFVDDTEQ